MTEMYKSLAIKFVIVALTAVGGYLHQSYGATDISALATDLVNAAFTMYSLYRVTNMKLVPHTSVAVIGATNPLIPGLIVKGEIVTGKIVGCLAFVIMALAWSQPLFAATAPPCNLQSLLSGINSTNFVSRLNACGTADVQGALDDANTAPVDNIALACLIPLQGIVASLQKQVAGQFGFLTAFQKFRRAKQSGIVGACQSYISTTTLLQ